MVMRRFFLTAGVLALSMGTVAPSTAQPKLPGNCGTCHALQRPAELSLQRLLDRKGPDLWYVGDKYNREWLVAWLQDPAPLRPGGMWWRQNATPGDPRDTIELAARTPHVQLDTAAANAAADALMQLHVPDLVPTGAFNPNGANTQMGRLAFEKLRGCAACHQGKGGNGGVSGVELTDAGQRLKADFVLAYTRDPQRFDQFIWMPRLALSDQDLQRLTAYVMTLRKEGAP